ncbi:MAG TPA: hypothetical protein VF595_16375 [Tepidisphaeraceae bacterium]|jgi:hypothetical protein
MVLRYALDAPWLHTHWFVAGLILLLVGCGPTRTAGTGGLASRDLAVLSIPQLPKIAHLQIDTIQFDGTGDAYKVGNGRDFYLPPRDHTASFTFKAILPAEAGFFGTFIPKDALTFPGPQRIPLGPMSAGRAYELVTPTEGFEKLLETGQLSFVREKEKRK